MKKLISLAIAFIVLIAIVPVSASAVSYRNITTNIGTIKVLDDGASGTSSSPYNFGDVVFNGVTVDASTNQGTDFLKLLVSQYNTNGISYSTGNVAEYSGTSSYSQAWDSVNSRHTSNEYECYSCSRDDETTYGTGSAYGYSWVSASTTVTQGTVYYVSGNGNKANCSLNNLIINMYPIVSGTVSSYPTLYGTVSYAKGSSAGSGYNAYCSRCRYTEQFIPVFSRSILCI